MRRRIGMRGCSSETGGSYSGRWNSGSEEDGSEGFCDLSLGQHSMTLMPFHVVPF